VGGDHGSWFKLVQEDLNAGRFVLSWDRALPPGSYKVAFYLTDEQSYLSMKSGGAWAWRESGSQAVRVAPDAGGASR
jgi:hypothetical protein